VLLMTVGLPGTGKSTFCRRLAPLIGATILESDALRRLLFEKPTHSARENAALFSALHEAARVLLVGGTVVIIDATSIVERDRRHLYRLASDAGARLAIACFDAPRRVIEERLRRRAFDGDPLDSSTADITIYDRMAPRFRLPARDHWLIDTSDSEAMEAALTQIAAYCRARYDGVAQVEATV
jgi:predicted kinase